MTSTRPRFFAFALAFILGACGGVRWHKADGDEAALTRDLAACRGQVQNRMGIPGGVGLATSMDPRIGAAAGPSQADQMMQESQALGFCMRQRGYALVPDGK